MKKLVSCLILTFVLLSLVPQVYADDEEVNMMNLPQYLSEKLGLPTGGDYFVGKILAGLIIVALFLLPTVFACGKFRIGIEIPALIVGLGALSFAVALGWFPVWLFVILILLIALMYANKMSNIFGGGNV